jgi:hypothetical protein
MIESAHRAEGAIEAVEQRGPLSLTRLRASSKTGRMSKSPFAK